MRFGIRATGPQIQGEERAIELSRPSLAVFSPLICFFWGYGDKYIASGIRDSTKFDCREFLIGELCWIFSSSETQGRRLSFPFCCCDKALHPKATSGGREFALAYTLRPQFITEGGQGRNHRGPPLAGSTLSSFYSPGPPRDDTTHSALGPPTSINDQNSLTQICPQVSLINNSPTQASLSDDSRLCQVDNLC